MSPADSPGDLEILRPWFNFVRRLRLAAKDGGTMGVLSIRLVVDENGMPLHWTEPVRTAIEPRAGNEQLARLLDSLGGKGNG